MGNDPDQPGSPGHFLQHPHGLFPGMLVQGTESFVNKHHIQTHRGGTFLDLIRHPQRQGKGRHKGFPAGKGAHLPLLSGNGRKDHQIQPPVFPYARAVQIPQPQGKLSCRHFFKPAVGPFQNPLQITALHKSLNIHPGAGHISVQQIIQGADALMPGHQEVSLLCLRGQGPIRALIGMQLPADILRALAGRLLSLLSLFQGKL